MILPILTAFLLTSPSVEITSTEVAQAAVVQTVAAELPQATVAAAPEILFVFPAEGGQFDPVVIFGTNFGDFPVPFFGFIPSVPLYTFNTPRIPFIGTLSVTITGVPFVLFPGVVDLTLVSNFRTSNAVDFRLL